MTTTRDRSAKWWFRVPKTTDTWLTEISQKLGLTRSATVCLAVARLHDAELGRVRPKEPT